MRPVFKCRHDDMEANFYKTMGENYWVIHCFPCGAKSIYNTQTHELTPHPHNKNRKNEENIYLAHFIDDDGKVVGVKEALDDKKSVSVDK